ncbi:MAG: hypothetical protein KBH06_07435 [Spirochaetes bacterium]|nr:hypothetical protein [Spirochaetota bacterium]
MKKLWNLGRVKQIVEEALGLEITHAYEDVAFVEHSAFIIMFDHDDLNKFKCYFSKDCSEKDREKLFKKINEASPRNQMTAVNAGTFSMEQLENEEIKLNFHDEK